MNVSPHLDSLRSKHAALDTKIQDEQRRPGADNIQLTSLKRQKLQLKEEIERLSTDVTH